MGKAARDMLFKVMSVEEKEDKNLRILNYAPGAYLLGTMIDEESRTLFLVVTENSTLFIRLFFCLMIILLLYFKIFYLITLLRLQNWPSKRK